MPKVRKTVKRVKHPSGPAPKILNRVAVQLLNGVPVHANSERQAFQAFTAKLSEQGHRQLIALRQHYGGLPASVLMEALIHQLYSILVAGEQS